MRLWRLRLTKSPLKTCTIIAVSDTRPRLSSLSSWRKRASIMRCKSNSINRIRNRFPRELKPLAKRCMRKYRDLSMRSEDRILTIQIMGLMHLIRCSAAIATQTNTWTCSIEKWIKLILIKLWVQKRTLRRHRWCRSKLICSTSSLSCWPRWSSSKSAWRLTDTWLSPKIKKGTIGCKCLIR